MDCTCPSFEEAQEKRCHRGGQSEHLYSICRGVCETLAPYQCAQFRALWASERAGAAYIEPAFVPSGRRGLELVAPLHTRDCNKHPWEGCCAKRPWEYPIVAAIPTLGSVEVLRVCVELLRLQTARPYIVIVDTGSTDAVCAELETMRADDLEVHYLRGQGYLNSSEPVSLAMELATARASTLRVPRLYCTHSDCFLRRREFLAWEASECTPQTPVVGYQMSPRKSTKNWQWCVSHTATMLYMPVMRAISVAWSIQTAVEKLQITGPTQGWPDTETCMNLIFRERGIAPKFIGPECNYCRELDGNRDHIRSYPSSEIYPNNAYRKRAEGWMASAIAEARQRVEEWGGAAAAAQVAPAVIPAPAAAGQCRHLGATVRLDGRRPLTRECQQG